MKYMNRENWARDQRWKLRENAKKAVVKTSCDEKLRPHPTLKNTWVVEKT